MLHVKPRTEKKVETFLRVWGFFHYLPVWTKVTKVQRRKVRVELPLFPGYVFTRLLPDERTKMLRTNLLVRAIEVSDPRLLVHQLRQIARAARNAPAFKVVNVFKEGDYVRVKTGPFMGVEGYVEHGSTDVRLVLNIEMLGRAVEFKISPADVERA